jgi:lipoprotein signal peptidase
MVAHMRGLRIWRAVSLAAIVIGMALMAFMIHTESELGAIPLGLLIAGATCYAVSNVKLRGPNT